MLGHFARNQDSFSVFSQTYFGFTSIWRAIWSRSASLDLGSGSLEAFGAIFLLRAKSDLAWLIFSISALACPGSQLQREKQCWGFPASSFALSILDNGGAGHVSRSRVRDNIVMSKLVGGAK